MFWNKKEKVISTEFFFYVKEYNIEQIYHCIKSEMNQTIALVCCYIGEEKTKNLIEMLPEKKKIEVMRKIAEMQRVSPDILREVERVIERKLETLVSEDFTVSGGKRF